MAQSRATPLHTALVRLTIGSFAAAALMGILALVGGGPFGSAGGRVLLTTMLVGLASIAMLCHLSTAGTPYQRVGIAGGIVLVLPVVTGLVIIWHDFETDPNEYVVKSFGIGAILAATVAQASLLLVLGGPVRPLVRRILAGTIALAGALAALLSAIVLGLDPTSFSLRLMGVIAILDVLGTVVVAALGTFGVGAVSGPEPEPLALPPDLEARVLAEAARSGRPADVLLAEAVERYLERSEVH